jgi:hypothetical protein
VFNFEVVKEREESEAKEYGSSCKYDDSFEHAICDYGGDCGSGVVVIYRCLIGGGKLLWSLLLIGGSRSDCLWLSCFYCVGLWGVS